MTHTPGPWKACKKMFGEQFVRQDPKDWNGMGYQLICSLPASRKGTHYGDMFAANAQLIAAAPQLLEACSSVWLMLSDIKDNELRLIADECRAAIEAATRAVPNGELADG